MHLLSTTVSISSLIALTASTIFHKNIMYFRLNFHDTGSRLQPNNL